jgi:hypothetical protein
MTLTSPTARTLKLLRTRGWTADVCERWIAQAGIKRDLFGVADVAAAHGRDRRMVRACFRIAAAGGVWDWTQAPSDSA